MAWRVFALLHRDSSTPSLSDAEIDVHDHKNRKVTKQESANSSVPDVATDIPPIAQDRTCPRVGFSTIQFRRFNRILGDSPGCEFPLSLGWNYVDSEPSSVDEFDDSQHGENTSYVSAKYMEPTTVRERRERLQLAGYTTAHLQGEERKRRMRVLTEWYNHNRTQGDQWFTYSFPENSTLLVRRYVCERPRGDE